MNPTRNRSSLIYLLLFIAIIVMGGLIMFSLGVVAEYVGALLHTAQGRPPFVIGDDPELGPLGEKKS